MITVLNTDKCTFRGNYPDEAAAMVSVKSLRDNFYLLDAPEFLLESEAISMVELRKFLHQFDKKPSDGTLANRDKLVEELWWHWQHWGERPYRKNAV